MHQKDEMMELIHTEIPGVEILRPKVFAASRGCFFESFSQKEFDSLVRPVVFVQDNQSVSSYGVVRGLHFQKGDASQGKLVRVVEGRVLDIAVDIRLGSPTFGKYVAIELSDENFFQLFIPRGFAHGFSVLSQRAVFQYKCDRYYSPGQEGAIAWDDPNLGIDWKIPPQDVVLSAKDAAHPLLKDCDCLFDYSQDLYAE